MQPVEHGGIEQRVWMHYRSLKMSRYSDGARERSLAPTYNVTPNWAWLLLARTHKMRVREVKDIINRKRGKNG